MKAFIVELFDIRPFGLAESVAHTIVLCEESEWHKIFQRFFSCYNMDWNASTIYTVDVCDCDISELDYDEVEFMQYADELNENNPFLLDTQTNSRIWHIINDHKYRRCTQDEHLLDYLATTNFVFE